MADVATWTVDHQRKRITVEVRLDFFVETGRAAPYTRPMMERALAEAERRWKGRFKCYEFVLKVNARFPQTRDQVRPDGLDVCLDDSLQGTAYTNSAGQHGHELSDDPHDVLTPTKGDPQGPIKSRWPPASNLVAHEIGHVLGLDDGYRDTPWWNFWGSPREVIPGHPADIMQDPAAPVLPSTITKAVRRHYGRALEASMHCPLALEAGPSEVMMIFGVPKMSVQARAERYDPPTSDPGAQPEPTRFKGTVAYDGPFVDLNGGVQVQSGSWETTFDVDLGKDPITIVIPWDASDDVAFSQTARWSNANQLPLVGGALLLTDRSGNPLPDLNPYWADTSYWKPAMYVDIRHADEAHA